MLSRYFAVQPGFELTTDRSAGRPRLQVLGRAGIATFLACLRQGVFFLPFILILPQFFGLRGIESAQPLAELLSFLVCIGFVVRFRREASHLAADEGAQPHRTESLLRPDFRANR